MAYTRRSTTHRKAKRTILRRTAALLLCFLLPAIPEAKGSNVGDSLVIGIQSTKTTQIRPLDPKERDIVSLYSVVYEGLITINDDYKPEPCLAESWEVSGDGRTWTFKLRTDAVFSDGTPLTANDVVVTVQYILARAQSEANADRGYYRNLDYFISKISANGDYTVIIKAKRKYYGLLYAMTFPILKASETDIDSPCGTGPYKITKFEAGNSMWLEANEYWWRQRPQVTSITALMHQTPNDVIESYQYAQVDSIFTRSISASQYSTGTSSLVMSYRTNQLEVLLMNNSSSAFPLDDVNVRRAIRCIVDADKLASNVYMGMVERTDTPLLPGTWLYNDELTSYFQYSTAEAARLLEEAGWTLDEDGVREKPKADGSGNYRLHLRFYTYEEPESNVRVEARNQIAEWLAAVGIETKQETLTMTDMADRLSAGNYDLALISYAMDTTPDPGFILMKGNTGNYARYKSDSMKELFDTLRTLTKAEDYAAQLKKIQRLYAEDCPFICLYYRKGVVLTRKMFTARRDVHELDLLHGIETFRSN